MNEKEAREIQNKGGNTEHFYYAHGYLEAIGKVKVLEEKSKKIIKEYGWNLATVTGATKEFVDVVAQWEKDK